MKLGVISGDYINLAPDNPHAFESQHIFREAEKHFEDVFIIDPFKCFIRYKSGKLEVICYDGESKTKNIFDEIDALYVKRTRGAINQILDILMVVNRFYSNIVIQDPFDSFLRPTSKVTSLIGRYGIFNQAETIVIFNKDFNPNDFPLEYPLVIKPSAGLQGIGVKLCRTKAELEQYISSVRIIGGSQHGYGFLIQEKINVKEEYRVIVIGNKSLGLVKKVQSENKFAKNYHQGAEFIQVEDKKAEEIGLLASNVAKQSFSGADVIITEEGEYYILECNRNPNYTGFQLATQINVSKLICEHIIAEIEKNRKRMAEKKRIFIGCSGKLGMSIAEYVHLNLSREFSTMIWKHSVFKLSKSNLASLMKATQNFDYAILILTPDDKVLKKEEEAFIPRDNVLFELGLFMGSLGPDNVFMLVPEEEEINLPTDLDGIVYATYQANHTDLYAGVDLGCIKIKNEIKSK